MNHVENKYERKGLKDRSGELLTLSLFIMILAVCSVFLVDLVIYPFSVFAINNVTLYNSIFKYTILISLIVFTILYIKKKVEYSQKVYSTKKEAYIYLLKRPLHYFTLFIITGLTVSIAGFIVYTLFSENYHLLYEIGGGK